MGVPELSYFQALGRVSAEMRTIAVTGTHGKTTTTAMIAAILKGAGKEPTAVVGSIVRDFESNFLEGGHTLVAEACEYKNHVLELSPEILVITNCELDHTDFFASERQLQELFRTAIEKLPPSGVGVTGGVLDHATLCANNTQPGETWEKDVQGTYGGFFVTNSQIPGFRAGEGARLANRYVDGVLTDAPLLPWPMQDRAANELGVDVTGMWTRYAGACN
jgi:UDP-N-acetylmuramate-alanine ligase